MEPSDSIATQSLPPKWKPIPAKHRRVLGVLVEKAKTTPNNYPLSLNAICTGCNQKSNRDPHMEIELDDAEGVLEDLREWGAVAEVHGDGRVIKYRHYMKDWLRVDGNELAIMAELLLRGAQTVGELRGRAARMAGSSLPDMTALRPLLTSLIERKLVIAITPEGRGQIVTHGLYQDHEMEKVTRNALAAAPTTPDDASPSQRPVDRTPPDRPHQNHEKDQSLHEEVASLRDEVMRLKKEIEDIWSNLR